MSGHDRDRLLNHHDYVHDHRSSFYHDCVHDRDCVHLSCGHDRDRERVYGRDRERVYDRDRERDHDHAYESSCGRGQDLLLNHAPLHDDDHACAHVHGRDGGGVERLGRFLKS